MYFYKDPDKQVIKKIGGSPNYAAEIKVFEILPRSLG
jgi:hypothetical protein